MATKAVVHTITVGPAPFGVAFGQNKAYVSNTGNGTLSIIDTSSYTVTGTINVPASNGLAATGDVRLVHASLNRRRRTADQHRQGPARHADHLRRRRLRRAVTDDGSTAWAVDPITNDIQQIDVATGTLGANVSPSAMCQTGSG